MKKLREAVMCKNGKNLDDLKFMDGKIRLCKMFLYFNFFIEFVHTSDLESLNSLILKYCPKTHVYR